MQRTLRKIFGQRQKASQARGGGIILFAIENRFGLKYWLGASEDHLQKPYVGLEGYEEPRTPRTFSKYELRQMLGKAGLPNHRFYYVLPDYKFPEVICTDEYMPDYMNLQKVSFTYSRNSMLAFDEKKLYKDIIENNVLDFFSNSFLVEAAAEPLPEEHAIYVSCRGEVKKDYRIATVITNDHIVTKKPVHKKAEAHTGRIADLYKELTGRGVRMLPVWQEGTEVKCRIFEGMPAQKYFEQLLETGDREGIGSLIGILRENLLKSSEEAAGGCLTEMLDKNVRSNDYGKVLSKGYVDMTFYNSFYENGELVFYDQEWCFDNIPLNFILYYAVKMIFTRTGVKSEITMEEVLRDCGIGRESAVYDELERRIWSGVMYRQTDFYGEGGYCNVYSEELSFRKILTDMERRLEEALCRGVQLEEANRRGAELEDRLSELQENYHKIVDSDTFKVFLVIRRGADFLFPENSLRRKGLDGGKRAFGRLIRIFKPFDQKNK